MSKKKMKKWMLACVQISSVLLIATPLSETAPQRRICLLIDQDSVTIFLMTLVSEKTPEKPAILRLRSIAARLKEILLNATTKTFWVRAQLVSDKGNRQTGHFYCGLVDVPARNGILRN